MKILKVALIVVNRTLNYKHLKVNCSSASTIYKKKIFFATPLHMLNHVYRFYLRTITWLIVAAMVCILQ